jgi:hypothetical protein
MFLQQHEKLTLYYILIWEIRVVFNGPSPPGEKNTQDPAFHFCTGELDRTMMKCVAREGRS